MRTAHRPTVRPTTDQPNKPTKTREPTDVRGGRRRQEVGEPEPGRGRPHVDLGQPARTPLLGSHLGDHRRLSHPQHQDVRGPESVAKLVGRRVAYLTLSDSLVIGPELDGGVSVVAKVASIEALDPTTTIRA
jgi:hypothetical protein